MKRILRYLPVVLIGSLVHRAARPDAAAVQIAHIALDKHPSVFNEANNPESGTRFITASILCRADTTLYFIRFLTLDAATGAGVQPEVNVWLPSLSAPASVPVRILHSRNFFPGECLVLCRDFQIVRVPLAVAPDGTPQPGPRSSLSPSGWTADPGEARAFAELPAAAFLDGKARLVIGTALGRLLVFTRSGAGVTLERDLKPTNQPVSDLGSVPRSGQIDLGMAAGSTLHGLSLWNQAYQETFRAATADSRTVYSFKVFNAPDRRLTGSPGRAHLAFSDGRTARLHFASITGDALGGVLLDTSAVNTDQITANLGASDRSLIYILRSEQTAVYFRPGYDDGSSVPGCVVNVTDSTANYCTPCPVALTGDTDNSGKINAVDVIRLVRYVFSGGPEPLPCPAAGDVDCNGKLTASDIVRIIRYIYAGGEAPCNVCSLFAGPWTCR